MACGTLDLLPAYPTRMFSIEFPTTRPVLVAMRSRGDFGANIGWMRAAGLSVGLTDQLGSA
ncbi:hypothetical protein EV656_1291, partial [Rhodovulum adriaticum]